MTFSRIVIWTFLAKTIIGMIPNNTYITTLFFMKRGPIAGTQLFEWQFEFALLLNAHKGGPTTTITRNKGPDAASP